MILKSAKADTIVRWDTCHGQERDRQDTALHDLKVQTDKEISQLRESLSKVERAVENQSIQMQVNTEQTNNEFKTLRAEAASQFQAMTNSFAESLKNAITHHDSQMSVQFLELKQLISCRGSGQSPPQKKPKNGQHNDDLWLGCVCLQVDLIWKMHSLLIHGILPYGRIPALDGYAPVYPCHASNAFSVFLPSFFRLDGNAHNRRLDGLLFGSSYIPFW